MADKHDKTEAPTAKKKREARKKGQIPRSQDLVMWAQMFAVAQLLPSAVGGAGAALQDILARVGHLIARPDTDQAVALLGSGSLAVTLALTPFMGGLLVIGLVGHLGQTGANFSGHGLKPKFEHLNLFKGIKKMVSPQSGWELCKLLLRSSILAGVAIPPVRRITDELMLMGRPDLHTILPVLAEAGVAMVRNTALAGLVLACVDYGLQKRRIMKMLKMSKQEIKDEAKQSDGDPHMKAAIRSKQAAMSRNRMMSEVGTATAVLVNPTHIAVAIRYVPGVSAPVVVAKGRGAVALRIREEAERHGVPIMKDIPLARALHASCELGQEIPVDFYEAVARILAVVMALKAA